MDEKFDNPLKWLIKRLPQYIEADALIRLMAAYEENKRRYYHALKIKDAERRIKIYESRPDRYDQKNLPRWREKLAKLKEQEKEL